MGTWTERLRRRWQSGDQTKDDKKTEDVSLLLYNIETDDTLILGDVEHHLYHFWLHNLIKILVSFVQGKVESTVDSADSSELEKTLSDKEEQIKASEEKIKDLQVSSGHYNNSL